MRPMSMIGPITGTLSCGWDGYRPGRPPCDPSWGEVLAILSLPFWPAFRLARKGADRILRRAYYRRERD